MTTDESAAPDEGPRSLDDLLLEWERRRADGESSSLEDLCRDAPELLEPLVLAVGRLLEIDRVLELPAVPSDPSDSRIATPPGPRTQPGDRVSATTDYQVERWAARGGQGDVFLARDEILGREVALKFLRLTADRPPETEARFLREARITGRLDHPGLVPVHGVGSSTAGAPWYAMRWVRGETLREAVERHHGASADIAPGARRLGLRGLLTRFVAVCNTVAYAHSRGVVHRDLKPVNILLGPFGETLVVDWGLAREVREADAEAGGAGERVDDSFELSLEGKVCGTPAYMSPEQTRGDQSAVGPASDQFSLGATLYQILTGRAPYSGASVVDVLSMASRGAYPRPRTLQPGVPRPLEAICLKAMAARPADRYASVLELGAEIDRWLSDATVAAYPDPWTVRLGRWARRHRTAVAAALALLATATIALGVSTALIGREQRRTTAALDDASANFSLAREAVDQLGARIGEERLLNEPGMEDLRRELLQTALRFHERFVERSRGDPGLIADLGRSHARVAAIRLQTGSPTAALDDYRQAVDQLRRAVRQEPAEARLRRDLASTLIDYAGACQRAGMSAEGVELGRDALDVEAALSREFPADAEAPRIRARALHTLGTLRLAGGEAGQAESALRSAVALEDQIAAGPAPRDKDLEALGQSLNNLAVLHRQAGRLDEADALYRRCLEIKRALVARQPGMADYAAGLATTGINHSRLLDQRGKLPDAIASATEAQATVKRLVEQYPRSTEFQFNLGQSHLQRGLLLLRDSQPAQAEREWRTAESVLRAVVQLAPGVERYVADLTNARTNLANLALDRGDLAGAREWADRAGEGLPSTVTGASASTRALVAEVAALRAVALEKSARHREAAGAWDLAASGVEGARRVEHRIQAARALARAGDAREAHRRVESILADSGLEASHHLELAATLGLAAAAASTDPATPSHDRQATHGRWADEAIALLIRARALGWKPEQATLRQFLDRPDFEAIRDRPGYQELLKAR